MLTPLYVKRHEGLWDCDILRISLYGVDEPSYLNVTKKRGAFELVKNNVIEFLKERQRRGAGPRVGFNFIVLVNTTDEVLRILDLVADIDAAVGGKGIDFLTLREDFSMREGDGLTTGERRALVDIFAEFHAKRARQCPNLSVDFGYALYPLSQGAMGKGLAMVGHDGMLPKAYPQVSVALDLLGDVYLYRDAVFPDRPGAARYKIGTLSKTRSMEMLVRDFLEHGAPIEPRPNDPWLMDAFDHVVTNLMWQGQADEQSGMPFRLGPIARRAYDRGSSQGGGERAKPAAVNYWQGLFGV
jgi:dTDP-4-amino-4,6-dideoxy-D-glucose ammonia-lyase